MYATKRRWTHAQAEELECWREVRHKLDDPGYLRAKTDYWRRILAKANVTEDVVANSDVLEVGAGPSGLFLLFRDCTRFVALDPLIDQYRGLVPHNFGRQRTEALKLEDYHPPHGFDIVFAINCIDHCDDIDQFLARLRETCTPDGRLYLAVNCHERRWTEAVWTAMQPILEPQHPYHFSEASYRMLLSRQFKIHATVDIEDDVIRVNKETAAMESQAPTPIVSRMWRRAEGWWSAARSGEIVGHAIFFLMRRAGYPAHDFGGVGRSIYRHKLFILSPL